MLNWNSRGPNPSSKSSIDFISLKFFLYQFSQHDSRGTETDDLYNF